MVATVVNISVILTIAMNIGIIIATMCCMLLLLSVLLELF